MFVKGREKLHQRSQAWWCMPGIPAIREAEVRGLKSEASTRQKGKTLSEK
jgi:hypothetical protein